jgi:aspartate kinase
MRVLKFGGTSVGSAERIKALVSLINDQTPKIVVLSAMSGTTNSLVDIANAFYAKDEARTKQLIEALENSYLQVVKDLYKSGNAVTKGNELINSHFNYLRSFSTDTFTAKEERAILAQGELLSTALLHYHLEEINTDSVLLPALNFMRIDENEEPDMKYIESNILSELNKYPKAKLFITQGYICRDAFG